MTSAGPGAVRRVWTGSVAVAAPLLVGLGGCGGGDHAAEASRRPLPVQTQPLAEQRFETRIEAIATLEAAQVVQLASQVSGRVIRLPVRQGQRVRRGQLILALDQDQLQAELASLRAQALTDRLNHERYEALVRQGAASAIQRDQYRQIATASRQTLAARTADLALRNVRAPQDGVLGELKLKLGDVVQAGVPFTQLVSNSTLVAELELPADVAPQLRVGQTVVLQAPGQGLQPVRTTLKAIDPSVLPGSQLLMAQAPVPALPDGDRWRNGLRIRADVVLGVRDQLAVPFAAVTRLAGQSFVYVVGSREQLQRNPGRADLRVLSGLPPVTRYALQVPVTLGPLQNNRYPVLSGVRPGQRVITTGLLQLRHGMPIKPR